MKVTEESGKMDYRILPRAELENMVSNFIIENKIYAEYGNDTDGLFIVRFAVEEEQE